MIIGIRTHFDAAHYLPNHPGRCKTMHGHRWTVEVEYEGKVGPSAAMIVDFGLLKEAMKQIIEPLDHVVLNDRIDNPTAETLVYYLRTYLVNLFPNVRLYSITVYETPDSWAKIIDP